MLLAKVATPNIRMGVCCCNCATRNMRSKTRYCITSATLAERYKAACSLTVWLAHGQISCCWNAGWNLRIGGVAAKNQKQRLGNKVLKICRFGTSP